EIRFPEPAAVPPTGDNVSGCRCRASQQIGRARDEAHPLSRVPHDRSAGEISTNQVTFGDVSGAVQLHSSYVARDQVARTWYGAADSVIGSDFGDPERLKSGHGH